MGLVCAIPSKKVIDTFKGVISSADIVELNRHIVNAGITDDDTIIDYIKNSIFLKTYIKDVDYTQKDIKIVLKNLFGPKGFKTLKPDTSGLNAFAINIEGKSEKEVENIMSILQEGFGNCEYEDNGEKVDFKFRIFKSASGKELIISFPIIIDNDTVNNEEKIDRLQSDGYNEYSKEYEINYLQNYTIADNNKKLIEPSIKNTLKLLDSLKEALGDKRLQYYPADRRITSIEKDTNPNETFKKAAYFTVGNFADHALRVLLPLVETEDWKKIFEGYNPEILNTNQSKKVGEKIREILRNSAEEIIFDSKREEIISILKSDLESDDIISDITLCNIAKNVQIIYNDLIKKHGENAKFITDTDRIPALLKGVNKTVSGEPDLYVIDNKDNIGHLYIYDFKTSTDVLSKDRKGDYFRQIVNYKKLLDSTNLFIDENGESIVHAGRIIYLQAKYESEPINKETKETKVTKIESLTPVNNYLIEIPKNEDIFKDHPNFTFESLFDIIEEQKKKRGITKNKKDEEDEEEIDIPLKFESDGVISVTELTEHAQNFAKNYSIFLDDIISGKRKINFNAPDYEILSDLIENNKSNRSFLATHLLDYYSNSIKNSLAYLSNKKSEYLHDNFDMFVKYAYTELIKLENISLSSENEVTTNTKNFDVSLEESEENGVLNRETSPIESWILSEMHISSKNRISQLVKRRLSLLRNGDEKDNVLFINEYVKDKIVIETLNHILVDRTTLTKMKEAIRNLSEPWGEELIGLIESDNVFASQFFTSFRNNALIFSTVIADKDENAVIHYRTHVINTDTEGTNFKNRLYDSFYSGNVGEIIKGGKYVKKVEKEIQKEYDEILEKLKQKPQELEPEEKIEIIKKTTDILKKLGFLVDENTVKIIFSINIKQQSFQPFKLFLASVASINTSSNSYFNKIKKKHENSKVDDFSDFCDYSTKGGVFQNIKNIIEKLLPGLQGSIESCCYENGKMYYTFQKPSKIHDTFKSILKGDHKLPKTSLFSIVKPTWLEDLKAAQNDAIPKDLFEIHTQITNDHVNFKDLDSASLWISMLSEYDSNGRKDMGFYRIPNYSDKPVSEYIGSWKYSKKVAIDNLVQVAHQEIDRIIEVLNYAKTHDKGLPVKYIDKDKLKKDKDKETIKKIEKAIEKLENNENLTAEDWAILSENTGAEFKFLKHLNNEIKKETPCGQLLLKIINGEGRESKEIIPEFIDLVGKAIEEDINKKAEEYYNKLENLDLLKIAEGKVNVDYVDNNSRKAFTYKLNIPIFKYLNNIVSYPNKTINKIINALNEDGEEINTDNVKKKIEEYKEEYEEELKDKLITYLQDFAANDHLASINIIQLTYGDLAYSPNEVDFQKRFTAFHSPMQRVDLEAVDENGNKYSEDGNCRVLHIHADKIDTEISNNIAALLDRKIEEASDAEKEAYEALKKQILEFFKKFDSTDGQGYSTLTGLRKKLGMLGRWKKEDEDALNAIRKGNFNAQTLAAAWQAMKPMIISQRQIKLDGRTTETMPYYVKDSEAILIFADALLGENEKNNPIKALMRDVENFNKKNPGLGIDTIVFDSAVKLGNTESLFINYSKNGDYKFEQKNFEDNSPYVAIVPFSDWGLQQEVPNHFVDDEQAEGSQQRILNLTDHNPDTDVRVGDEIIKAKEAIERVEKLEAHGIIKSYEELAERLGIKETDKVERNKKLAKILQEEILEDSRFGMDLLTAVTLNENNDFTVPLGEAMHSTRIQQLINSIIKKHINKQYFKGGPAPQVAIMSDNLHIRFHGKDLTLDEYFNKNKKEKGYSSVEDKKCVEDYKEYLKENQAGNILFTLNEFLEECKKENKHASVKNYPASVEGYKKYLKDNQAGMAYWEVYTVCPDENLEKLLREAGKQAGKDYMSNLDEAVKDGIIPESITRLIGYRIPTEDKYSIAPMKIKGFLPRTSGEVIILPKEVVVITGSDFDIDKMFLMTKSFEYIKESEFEAVIKKGKSSKKIKLNIKVKEAKEKDDFKNELFDLKWGLLTTEDNALKAFNPGNFEELKKQSLVISIYTNMIEQGEIGNDNFDDIFNELQNKSVSELQKLSEKYAPARDITYADTQVDFFDANMEGKKLVGIFANANTAHGFLSLLHMKGVGVKLKDDFKKFTLVGKEITGGTEIDPVMAFDGVTYVSKNLAKCLAAAVDVAKDNAVFGLNLNTFTASVACLLIRLGYDIKTVGLLLNQPAVKEVQKKFFNSKEYLTKETAIDKVIQEYSKNNRDAEDSSQGLEEEEIEITEEDLLEGIRTGKLDNQIHILNLFKRLMATATHLTELSNLTKFNSISNAPGPNISNNIALLRRVARFMNDENTIFDDNAKRVFENSPILKAFYTTTLQDPSYYATEPSEGYPEEGIATQIFKMYFPHYKKRIKNIIDIIENNCKISLNAKDIDLIINQFLLFSLTNKDKEFLSCIGLNGDKAVLDFSKNKRENLLTLPLTLKEIFENKENEGIKDENQVLKLAKIAKSTKQCNFPTVNFHAGNLDAEQQEDIKNAWTDLVKADIDLALSILKYEIFRSGFSFSPKTINHLVSVFTKYNLEGYIPAIRMLCEGDFLNHGNSEYLEQLYISQFYRNNSNKIKLVPIVTDNDDYLGQKILTTDDGIQTGIKFSYNPEKYYRPEFYIKTESDMPEFFPYIKYKGKLYKFDSFGTNKKTGEIEVEYEIVSPLGIANNFIEYDAQASDDNKEDNMKSIFIGKNIKDRGLKEGMNVGINKQKNDDDNGEEEDADDYEADDYEADQNVEDDDDELSFTSVNLQKKSKSQVSSTSASVVKTYNGNWTRQSVANDPNNLYIFTDNTDRDSGSGLIPAYSWYSKKYGKGHHFPTTTAAVIRGLDNARPISTQKWYHQGAKGSTGRWDDADFDEFKKVIDDEFDEILKAWNTGKYKTIIFPQGNGLFNTKISQITMERTPKLYQYLQSKYQNLINSVNESDELRDQQQDTQQEQSSIKSNKDNNIEKATSILKNNGIEVSKKDEENAKKINEETC